MKTLLAIFLLLPSLSMSNMTGDAWRWHYNNQGEMATRYDSKITISWYLSNGYDVLGTGDDSIHLWNKKKNTYVYCFIEKNIITTNPTVLGETCVKSMYNKWK